MRVKGLDMGDLEMYVTIEVMWPPAERLIPPYI